MSLVDELKAQAEAAWNTNKTQIFSAALTASQQYIQSRVLPSIVKIGAPPSGNLTPLQLQQGQVGTPTPLAPPASNTTIAGISAMKIGGIGLPVIAALGIGAYFLTSKKRRG